MFFLSDSFKLIKDHKKNFIFSFLFDILFIVFFTLIYGFLYKKIAYYLSIVLTFIANNAKELIIQNFDFFSIIKLLITSKESMFLNLILFVLLTIICIWVLYCIFQGFAWYFSFKIFQKSKIKSDYFNLRNFKLKNFFFKFFKINAIWMILFSILYILYYLFFVFANVTKNVFDKEIQTPFIILGVIFIILFYFIFLSYNFIILNSKKLKNDSKKNSSKDKKTKIIKNSFIIGFKNKKIFFFYILFLIFFMLINLILMINLPNVVSLLISIFIIFPFIAFFRISLFNFLKAISKDND